MKKKFLICSVFSAPIEFYKMFWNAVYWLYSVVLCTVDVPSNILLCVVAVVDVSYDSLNCVLFVDHILFDFTLSLRC